VRPRRVGGSAAPRCSQGSRRPPAQETSLPDWDLTHLRQGMILRQRGRLLALFALVSSFSASMMFCPARWRSSSLNITPHERIHSQSRMEVLDVHHREAHVQAKGFSEHRSPHVPTFLTLETSWNYFCPQGGRFQYSGLDPDPIFPPSFHLVVAVDRIATVAHYLVSFEIRPVFHVCIPSVELHHHDHLCDSPAFRSRTGSICMKRDQRPYPEPDLHLQASTGYDSRSSSIAKHQTPVHAPFLDDSKQTPQTLTASTNFVRAPLETTLSLRYNIGKTARFAF